MGIVRIWRGCIWYWSCLMMLLNVDVVILVGLCVWKYRWPFDVLLCLEGDVFEQWYLILYSYCVLSCLLSWIVTYVSKKLAFYASKHLAHKRTFRHLSWCVCEIKLVIHHTVHLSYSYPSISILVYLISVSSSSFVLDYTDLLIGIVVSYPWKILFVWFPYSSVSLLQYFFD